MTGFGRSSGEQAGIAWVWELRSVNGRGLDVRLRTPNGMDALEATLREDTARALKRGNVSATLTVKREDAPQMQPDPAALAQVMALALDLAQKIPGAPAPRAEALLALPGVLKTAQPQSDEAAEEALRTTIHAGYRSALDGLVQARLAEGARLGTVLTALLDEISALRNAALTEAATQPAQQRERLQTALAELLDGRSVLTEDRLAQELALLASKSDVREELDRLAAHIDAARALLAEGANIGRKFDFLVQEFNREANTLCSKSATVRLTAIGLDLKAAIEQLREQVQNIE